MKKIWFYILALCLPLTACQWSQNDYGCEQEEIALYSVSKSSTKAPMEGTTFTHDNMQVAAYLAAGDGAEKNNYFDASIFTKKNGLYSGGQYWPVSAATINFLAVAPFEDGKCTTDFNSENHASGATCNLSGNETMQHDVVYGFVRAGKQAGQAPDNVGMMFHHALAWVDFVLSTSTPVTTTKIRIDEIRTTGSACDGTLTLAIDNAGETTSALGLSSAVWSDFDAGERKVNKPANDFILSTAETQYNKGILLVPECGMTGFEMDYTIIVQGNEHQFTYTNNVAPTLSAGKKYTYNIVVSLTEIKVDIGIDNWEDWATDEENKLPPVSPDSPNP